MLGNVEQKYPLDVDSLSLCNLHSLQQKQQYNLNMNYIDLFSSVQYLSLKIKQKEVRGKITAKEAKKVLTSILYKLSVEECIELCEGLELDENFCVTDFLNIKVADLCRLIFILESRQLIKFNSEITRAKWNTIIVENFTINGNPINYNSLYNIYSDVMSKRLKTAERLLAEEIRNILPTGASKQLF